MYRPLVISRSYLWEKSSVGQIQRVFWEYMSEHDFQPTVICSKSVHNDIPINSLKCRVIPTYDSQAIRYFIAFLKRAIAADFAYLPDYSKFSWANISAIKKAKKEAISGKYDHLFSVCTPFSDHLIALEAKKVSGLPWVASFYDPWYDNPYRPFKYRRFLELDRKYELSIANNADAIIHTNYSIYNEWTERYGESIKKKMYVMPLVFNSFSSGNKGDLANTNKTKYVISHIGTLYSGRDSTDFLRSLKMMLDKHPEVKEQFILNYVGTVTDNDRNCVKEFDLSSQVNFLGRISEQECCKYFEQTDLFLAVDGKDARNIFFPSKIMKYLFYGKPILGLTPKGSALQYELNNSHNFCFTNEDYSGISNFLYHAITDLDYPSGFDTTYWKKFTMEEVRPQYLSIVKKILKNR